MCRTSSAKEPHGVAKHACMEMVFLTKQKSIRVVQSRMNTSEIRCMVPVTRIWEGLSQWNRCKTGVFRLTREWRVRVKRGEKKSLAWQHGRLTEGITAVHNTSSGWSSWERKKLVFLEDKPGKKPHTNWYLQYLNNFWQRRPRSRKHVDLLKKRMMLCACLQFQVPESRV